MGVINCTPDSFYPESRTPTVESAVAQGFRLAEEGADWLDIGGQSTRPGSEPVPLDQELARVLPVVETLAGKLELPISIDTDKLEVAQRARQAGAKILNDVAALRADPGMVAEAVKFEAVVLMHRGGDSPKTMQQEPRYHDVVAEVKAFFEERIAAFTRAGGDVERIFVDPGIGFGKNLDHNLSLLKHLGEFDALARVVLGVSRKSFLSRITPDCGPRERLEGSLAAAVLAAAAGVAVLRVHDVAATRRALEVVAAVQGAA